MVNEKEKELVEEISTPSYTREEKGKGKMVTSEEPVSSSSSLELTVPAAESKSSLDLVDSFLDVQDFIPKVPAELSIVNSYHPEVLSEPSWFLGLRGVLKPERIDFLTDDDFRIFSTFNYNTGNYSRMSGQWEFPNLKGLTDLLHRVEIATEKALVPVYQDNFNKLKELAQRAIEKNINDSEVKFTRLQDDLSERDETIVLNAKEISDYKDQIASLKERLLAKDKTISSLKQQVKYHEDRIASVNIDWREVRESSRLAIASPEHYLATQIALLEKKYSNLEHQNLSDKEILALTREQLREYIALASRLGSIEFSLKEDLKALKGKLQERSQEIVQVEVNNHQLIRDNLDLKEELESAKRDITLLQNEKLRFESVIASGKAMLDDWKSRDDERREIYDRHAIENAVLSLNAIDLNREIERLKAVIEEGTKLLATKDEKITNLESSLRNGNRKKKVLTVSNWIRYGTSYFVNEKTQEFIDTSITAITSYYVIRDLDNWSYEAAFMGFGILAYLFLKKFRRWWKGQPATVNHTYVNYPYPPQENQKATVKKKTKKVKK